MVDTSQRAGISCVGRGNDKFGRVRGKHPPPDGSHGWRRGQSSGGRSAVSKNEASRPSGRLNQRRIEVRHGGGT